MLTKIKDNQNQNKIKRKNFSQNTKSKELPW